MNITVKLFAVARKLFDQDELILNFENESSVRAMRLYLQDKFPNSLFLLNHCLIAVNGKYVDENSVLLPGDEVALLPPVSGG